jgi:3-oxoacyl-[acyl-carrier-protein] synthase III
MIDPVHYDAMGCERSSSAAQVGIKDVAGYLPGTRRRNVDIAERLGFQLDFLTNKVGVEMRYESGADESTSDMCVKAFERLKARHANDLCNVGLVLLCTQNPDYKLPHTSSVLQHRLGLPQNLLAFDISLGCSGYVASLVTAKALMTEMDIGQALVFTCDPYTKVLAPDDKSTVPLFSDAATVSLLEVGAPIHIGKAVCGNDGGSFDALIIRGSGTARTAGEKEQPLRMDGRRIFSMLKKEVPVSIKSCLQLNCLSPSQVDLYLFHQASAWLLRVLCAELDIAPERVPSNLKSVGNTVSSSIPLLLEELITDARPLPRTMLLSGFGVGLSWASVILTTQAGEESPAVRQ